jgi:hypothetical protein
MGMGNGEWGMGNWELGQYRKMGNTAKFGSLGINPQAKSEKNLKVTERKINPQQKSNEAKKNQ